MGGGENERWREWEVEKMGGDDGRRREWEGEYGMGAR
jgi:hypothetical protein